MYRLMPFSWSADIQLMSNTVVAHPQTQSPPSLTHSLMLSTSVYYVVVTVTLSVYSTATKQSLYVRHWRKFTVCAHKTHTKNVKWPLSSEAEISAKGPGCGESSMPQRQTWVDWKPRANKYRIEVDHSGDLHSGPQMRSRGSYGHIWHV